MALTCDDTEPTPGLEPGTTYLQGRADRPGRHFAFEHRAQRCSKTSTESRRAQGRSYLVVT